MASKSWEDDAVVVGRDDVSDFNPENILPQPPEILAKIRSWLQPTDYDAEGSEFRKHSDSYLPGTGEWILSSDTYRKWHASSDDGLLWIRGIPGSGKSVCAASLINKLATDQVPVLFFFFRQIIDANHNHVSALRDWLVQILKFSPPLQLELQKHVKEYRAVDSLAINDLWRYLRLGLSHQKAYIVVDALDEMDQSHDTEAFLESLADLSRWRPSKMKVIITSRPVPSVERPLRLAKTLNIFLEERMVDLDIMAYVQSCLEKSTIPHKDQIKIKAAVPGRANGLFLYAKLSIDRFLRRGADVQKVLEDLPLNLNVLYTDLLYEHKRRSNISDEMQLLIMQWVTHATRPLRLLEIAEMINTTQFQEAERDLGATKELVRSACGPLLEILPDETICVVHHSLTEFLTGSTRQASEEGYPILELGATHNRLALICLSYLQSECLDKMVPNLYSYDYNSTKYVVGSHGDGDSTPPFMRYAAANWSVHVRKASAAGADQTEINQVLSKLLMGEDLVKMADISRSYRRSDSHQQEMENSNATPLYYAVSQGLAEYTKMLLQQSGIELGRGGKLPQSPLCYAARKGYDDIASLLLKHGADCNEHVERYGDTPLVLAVKHNHPRVVSLLLEAGVDPWKEIQLSNGCDDPEEPASPVEIGCRWGHVHVVRQFLPYFVTTEQANSALAWAVDSFQSDVVELLIKNTPVDVDARSGLHGATGLYRACSHRDAPTIKLLLEAGANPNFVNTTWNRGTYRPWDTKQGEPAIMALVTPGWASSYRHNQKDDIGELVDCVRLLVASGADIHLRDNDGNPILHVAKEAAFVRILLDVGADPNATNNKGETALHFKTDLDVLQLLLEEGNPDVNLRAGPSQRTPLLVALAECSLDSALQLLQHGADATAVDADGNGAFHFAAVARVAEQEKLIELLHRLISELVQSGVDINLRNNLGNTPLHVMCTGLGHGFMNTIHPVTVSSFIEAGADPEIRNNKGQTPLFTTISGNNSGIYPHTGKMLIKAVVAIDYFTLKDIRELLDLGLDPKKTDNDGNTLWHELVPYLKMRHWGPRSRTPPKDLQEITSLISVDMLQPNNNQRTPLHNLSMWQPGGLNNQTYPDKEGFTALEYLASFGRVNHPDKDGITPLHLASTFCEYSAKKLLEHGADPTMATLEGMTALHIAARSRQSNIVGRLLDALRTRLSPEKFLAVISGTGEYVVAPAPLYFACASGRPETVRLLLEAGATVELQNSAQAYTAWLGCLEFETEAGHWPLSDLKENSMPDAGDVSIEGVHRTKQGRLGRYWTERLDEIIQMLANKNPAAAAKFFHEPIKWPEGKDNHYTIECFASTAGKMGVTLASKPIALGSPIPLSREDTRAAILNGSLWKENEAERSKFDKLMALREYDIMENVIPRESFLEVDQYGKTILHELVEGGFASVIAKVTTLDDISKVEDWEWCKKAGPPPSDGCYFFRPELIQPLLLAACRRKLPNMDVLRLLVEVFGVNVNVQSRKSDPTDYSNGPDKRMLKDKSALHCLIRGGHWWQTAEALPYLIQHGADLEVRDENGLTPLNTALHRIGLLRFDRRAVEILVRAGADVNSTDARGVSCLERTVSDVDIMKLLISHGAKVSRSTLMAAIRQANPEALEALLSSGADPNTWEPDPETSLGGKQATRRTEIDENKAYPLHYAATSCLYGHDPEDHSRMIQLLLDNGADPCAKYVGTTVMHEIIARGSFLQLFVELPGLDIEAKDDLDRTLFLTACSSSSSLPTDKRYGVARSTRSPAEILLDRGANIRARDKGGNNALHLVQNGHTFSEINRQLMERIVREAPELVNQKNNKGWTPIHEAVENVNPNFSLGGFAGILLSAGGDPHIPAQTGDTLLHILFRGSWWVDSKCEKVEGSRLELLNRFLADGLSLEARNKNGETPIFGFFQAGGVQVHHIEGQSHTLDAPTVEGTKRVLELFKTLDINWQAVNKKRESLLHIAAARNMAVGFQFLLEMGLDPMAESKKHRTPLDVASEKGATPILELFKKK
ncbi:ankyrin [Thozetella sp. PMI_491]|nr:ankyrin [Thozetella sp. PMI_491]